MLLAWVLLPIGFTAVLPAAGVRQQLGRRKHSVLSCATDEPLWEEELEQREHLAQVAAAARRIERLKALACPTSAALAGARADGDEPSAAPPTSAALAGAHADGDEVAQDDVLWDEDVESFEMLQQMAAWDRRVAALKEAAAKGGHAGPARGTSRLGRPQMVHTPAPAVAVHAQPESAAAAAAAAMVFPSAAEDAPARGSTPVSSQLLAADAVGVDAEELPWQKKPFAKYAFGFVALLSVFHGLLASPKL